jgi:Flp pilus assembly protein TadG
MLVILGFVGLAIDAGRLQLVQAELQNSADACVLAAVLELNGLSDAPSRGALAGQFVSVPFNSPGSDNEFGTLSKPQTRLWWAHAATGWCSLPRRPTAVHRLGKP